MRDAILLAQLIRNDITTSPPSPVVHPPCVHYQDVNTTGKGGNYIKGVSLIRYAFYMNDKHNLYYLRDRHHTIIH